MSVLTRNSNIKFYPRTETGTLPYTLIPCEHFTKSQYNLETGQIDERTGYAARISDVSRENYGVVSIPIHGGKFITIIEHSIA